MSIDSNNIEFSEKIIFNFHLRIKQTHYLCVSIRKTSDAHELHQVMRMSCTK